MIQFSDRNILFADCIGVYERGDGNGRKGQRGDAALQRRERGEFYIEGFKGSGKEGGGRVVRGGIGDAWSKGKRSERGRAKRGRKLIRLTNYMCSNSVKETSCYGGIHKCV